MRLLKDLYCVIKESVEILPGWPDKPTLLLVDDLSILTSIGYQPFEVAMFAHYLQDIVCHKAGCMACLVHTEGDATDEWTPLHCIIGHQSETIISVQPMKTGYCRELDGEVNALQ